MNPWLDEILCVFLLDMKEKPCFRSIREVEGFEDGACFEQVS